MKLQDYQAELLACEDDPFAFFENYSIRDVKVGLHPDRWIGQEDLSKHLFQEFVRLYNLSQNPKIIHGCKVVRHIARGDISDVYLVMDDKGKYILKVPYVKAAYRLLQKEVETLNALTTDSIYGDLLPKIEKTVDKNLFYNYNRNIVSGSEVMMKYPELDGRHIIWMLKRLLMVTGYIHKKGYVHGAITPDHALFDASNHGAILCDWIHAGKIDDLVKMVPAKWKHFYPDETIKTKKLTKQLDIYMIAKTMLVIGGKNMPHSIKRFLESCTMPLKMIPDNAWKLHDEVKDLSKNLYGNSKFVTFEGN